MGRGDSDVIITVHPAQVVVLGDASRPPLVQSTIGIYNNFHVAVLPLGDDGLGD